MRNVKKSVAKLPFTVFGRELSGEEVAVKDDFLERELLNIGMLEAAYGKVVKRMEPAGMEEDAGAARLYLAALRGMERCVELRLKLIREAERLPDPEPEEPMAMIDLSRLSDGALREVETALVPVRRETGEDR